jgi:hypothetical protein
VTRGGGLEVRVGEGVAGLLEHGRVLLGGGQQLLLVVVVLGVELIELVEGVGQRVDVGADLGRRRALQVVERLLGGLQGGLEVALTGQGAGEVRALQVPGRLAALVVAVARERRRRRAAGVAPDPLVGRAPSWWRWTRRRWSSRCPSRRRTWR